MPCLVTREALKGCSIALHPACAQCTGSPALSWRCFKCGALLFQGRSYDGKTDIWAIGCILYELCSLKKAFDASNVGAITVKVMRYSFRQITPSRLASGSYEVIRVTYFVGYNLAGEALKPIVKLHCLFPRIFCAQGCRNRQSK